MWAGRQAAIAARAALDADAIAPTLNLLRQSVQNVSTAEFEDYMRFLSLKVAANDYHAALLSPPRSVDRIWHEHLLDTIAYEEICAAHRIQ